MITTTILGIAVWFRVNYAVGRIKWKRSSRRLYSPEGYAFGATLISGFLCFVGYFLTAIVFSIAKSDFPQAMANVTTEQAIPYCLGGGVALALLSCVIKAATYDFDVNYGWDSTSDNGP